MDQPDLGRRIRIARIGRAMRRKDLAAAIGKSYGHVANIENGHSQPSPETLVDIANALGLKIDLAKWIAA
jgi:transcriptional regulator with XRE-family HTH domain